MYTILDSLKKVTPQQEPQENKKPQAIYESVEAKGSILEGVAKVEEKLKEQFAELSNLLNTRLTPLEKSVFEKYAEEDSYKDIAKSLDQTPKAVDNALMRIRKKAREVLLAYENGVLQETLIFEESIIEHIIEDDEDPQ
jgi:DNA-directed RNA polymerase specialized sigma24 family protein